MEGEAEDKECNELVQDKKLIFFFGLRCCQHGSVKFNESTFCGGRLVCSSKFAKKIVVTLRIGSDGFIDGVMVSVPDRIDNLKQTMHLISLNP